MTQRDILARVPLGDATFELAREVAPASSYDGLSGGAVMRAGIETGRQSIPIDSLRALTRWAVEHGVDLPIEVAKDPAAFAEFIRHFELGKRVVSNPELFSFVEQEFDVSLEHERPRVEGAELLFLCGEFSLDREAPRIWRVRADLVTGYISEEPVQPRSVPPDV